MSFHFTSHAKDKFLKVEKAGFTLSQKDLKDTISNPLFLENRTDGTYIASSLLDKNHILRVVYRKENDIIIVITFYPAKRKRYEI